MYKVEISIKATSEEPIVKYKPMKVTGLYIPQGKLSSRAKIEAEIERQLMQGFRSRYNEAKITYTVKIEKLKTDFCIRENE